MMLMSSRYRSTPSGRRVVGASLVGGFCGHLASTAVWTLLQDPVTTSVLEVPLRALGWSMFAPYLAVVYAAVGGTWLCVVGRATRWPTRPALALIMAATTPLLFAASAIAFTWLLVRGNPSIGFESNDVVIYLLVAPAAFSLFAVACLGGKAPHA
jgi:hypothetical protein